MRISFGLDLGRNADRSLCRKGFFFDKLGWGLKWVNTWIKGVDLESFGE